MTVWIVAGATALLLYLGVEGYLRYKRITANTRQATLWAETQERLQEAIHDPDRLASLEQVHARLGAQKSYLDMICRSTAASLRSKRAVVTLVDGERQKWIASHFVDPEEDDKPNADGVSYDESYCQYVIASDSTFIVDDAKNDDRVEDHPCFTVLGMRAYLGTPVYSREGFPVGSLCVFDTRPRKWTNRDIVTLESFASLVSL